MKNSDSIKKSQQIIENIYLLPKNLKHNYAPPTEIIQKARKQSSISQTKLRNILMNDRFQYYWRKTLDFILKSDLEPHLNPFEESNEKLRQSGITWAVKLWRNLGITYEDFLRRKQIPEEVLVCMGFGSIDGGTRFGVHMGLYGQTLFALGTEKHDKWKKRAIEMRDLGCFMLTEMGHGSNVQGILTTATYCHSDQTFIINTPVDIGMKFWIGNLALTANMGVLFAQLIANGKNQGVHAFLIPIRDEEGNIVPGMMIGDCGTKMGQNGVDNGWVMFSAMKVTKDALLDKFSWIDENGKFKSKIKKTSQRFAIQISALTAGRLAVSLSSVTSIFVGCSIGLRYCTVRRQFGESKGMENTLMDYPLVNSRLAQFISSGLTYSTVSYMLFKEWNEVDVYQIKDPRVKELHSLSSFIKAASSWVSLKALGKVRELCGGHGYSSYSFIPTLMNYTEVNITWEGSNEVLIQQTAKNLLDEFNLFQTEGQIRYKTLEFLRDFEDDKVDIGSAVSGIQQFGEEAMMGDMQRIMGCLGLSENNLTIPEAKGLLKKLEDLSAHLLRVMQLRVFEMVDKCLGKFAFFLTQVKKTKDNFFMSFNKSLPDILIPTCIFYGELFCFEQNFKLLSFIGDSNSAPPFFSFIPHFRNLDKDEHIFELIFLRKITILFACSTLSRSDKFLMGAHEAIDYEFFDCLGDLILKFSESLRYDLLTFSDVFLPAELKFSSLGNFDGDVYNHIKNQIFKRRSNFGKSNTWQLLKDMKKQDK